MHFYSDQAFLFRLFVHVNIAIDSTQMGFKFPLLSTEAGHTQVPHWILAATSSSKVVLSTGWSVHENSPFFAYHSFCPRQLKFGIDVKCVCVCVCVCVCAMVCVCVHAHWVKGGMEMGVACILRASLFITFPDHQITSCNTSLMISCITGW